MSEVNADNCPHLTGVVHGGYSECEMGKACDLDCEWYELEKAKEKIKVLENQLETLDGEIVTVEITQDDWERYKRYENLLYDITDSLDYIEETATNIDEMNWGILDWKIIQACKDIKQLIRSARGEDK